MRMTNNYDLIGAMRTEKRREIALRNQEVFLVEAEQQTDRHKKKSWKKNGMERERERERERESE